MKQAIFILIILLTLSCRTQKETRQTATEYVTKVQTDTIQIVERDTIFLYHPAPEVSTSQGIDSSYLETSLAWSKAMLKNGILVHQIGNKNNIPIRVPNANRIEYKSSVTNTDSKKENEIKQTNTVEKFRFMNSFFYYSGITFYFLIVIIVIVGIITWRKGKGGS